MLSFGSEGPGSSRAGPGVPGVCEGGGPQVRGTGKGLGFQGPGGGL